MIWSKTIFSYVNMLKITLTIYAVCYSGQCQISIFLLISVQCLMKQDISVFGQWQRTVIIIHIFKVSTSQFNDQREVIQWTSLNIAVSWQWCKCQFMLSSQLGLVWMISRRKKWHDLSAQVTVFMYKKGVFFREDYRNYILVHLWSYPLSEILQDIFNESEICMVDFIGYNLNKKCKLINSTVRCGCTHFNNWSIKKHLYIKYH